MVTICIEWASFDEPAAIVWTLSPKSIVTVPWACIEPASTKVISWFTSSKGIASNRDDPNVTLLIVAVAVVFAPSTIVTTSPTI